MSSAPEIPKPSADPLTNDDPFEPGSKSTVPWTVAFSMRSPARLIEMSPVIVNGPRAVTGPAGATATAWKNALGE
jgi:hypothetical protein